MKKIAVFSLSILLLAAGCNSASNSPATAVQSDAPAATVIADHLDTPWAMAFLPDNSLLVTERPGRVRFIDSQGHLDATPAATITAAREIGEGGVLGIALHPKFSTNHYVYLYYTYKGSGNVTLNRIVRMSYADKKLSAEKIIFDNIPGAPNHDGGRIKFGPDGYLYITTGDAENPSQAQDTNALGGKILRLTDEGQPAPGNPFHNFVYSYGHRNPQGLAWDSQGQLWATEHGRSTPTGFDELNRIQAGKNYGWPTIQGDQVQAGMETPVINSGAVTTWAPSGAAIIGNAIFFGGLKGQSLYSANINSGTVKLTSHLHGQFGRIRDVVIGPDGLLYITTSNRDGRGTPTSADDRVIKVNPNKL